MEEGDEEADGTTTDARDLDGERTVFVSKGRVLEELRGRPRPGRRSTRETGWASIVDEGGEGGRTRTPGMGTSASSLVRKNQTSLAART